MTSTFEQITVNSLPVQPNKVEGTGDPNEIITVPVNTIAATPIPKTDETDVQKPPKSTGLMGKFKSHLLSPSPSSPEASATGKSKLKVVFMPRSEYLKYFAHSDAKTGLYSGIESARTWTEEELDEMFAQYVPAKANSRKPSFMDKVLAPLGTPGA